jgi:hypothetical protein
VETALWFIYGAIIMLLMFKDMSGKEELKKIREQMEKIVEKMER